jgi:hypothetical protein
MLCSGKAIGAEDLRFDEYVAGSQSVNLPEPEEGFNLTIFLEETKHRLIERALEKSNHVQSRAARLLDLTPQAVNQHLKARRHKQK